MVKTGHKLATGQSLQSARRIVSPIQHRGIYDVGKPRVGQQSQSLLSVSTTIADADTALQKAHSDEEKRCGVRRPIAPLVAGRLLRLERRLHGAVEKLDRHREDDGGVLLGRDGVQRLKIAELQSQR